MDVEKTLEEELTDYLDLFMKKGCTHACNVEGCSTCVVIDGHMKAHRKICGKKGCIRDPREKSKYCDFHHSGSFCMYLISDPYERVFFSKCASHMTIVFNAIFIDCKFLLIRI